MRISGKRRCNFVGSMAIAALGLAMVPAAGFAQTPYQSSQPSPDAGVAARVKQALQANPTLDARHIDVAVEHGTVVLKGFVQDSRAVIAAEQTASEAAGDRKIDNRIIIKQNYPNAP